VRYVAHLVVALALVLFASRTSSASPPTATAVVFEAVDAVTVRDSYTLFIEGLVQGETQPRTVLFSFGFQSQSYDPAGAAANCYHAATLAMARPGRFFVEFDRSFTGSSNTFACTLRRR
jgi:hypothetical protein